VYIHEFLKVS